MIRSIALLVALSSLALPAQRVVATHLFTDADLLSTRPAGDTDGDGIGDSSRRAGR